jgi:hypothetical protein
LKHPIGLFLPFFLGSVKSTSDRLTVETLEQLKEMAEKYPSIDLEMIEALTQLNFKNVCILSLGIVIMRYIQAIYEITKSITSLRNKNQNKDK